MFGKGEEEQKEQKREISEKFYEQMSRYFASSWVYVMRNKIAQKLVKWSSREQN